MNKTVLITGSSSGIGRATAYFFQNQGWNVIATMRSPDKESELSGYRNVLCTELDVTKPETIQRALKAGLDRFGNIDVIVNNAGYGLSGVFEFTSLDQIKAQFSTNVFGVMEVVRQCLPYFRSRPGGLFINVTSMGGRITFPLYSVYHASKWAVEGLSESLQYELRPFRIQVKCVEPGAIKTEFYGRSADTAKLGADNAYDMYTAKAVARMQQVGNNGVDPKLVAKTIFRAASDGKQKLRYPVGPDARALLFIRRWIPEWLFFRLIRLAVKIG